MVLFEVSFKWSIRKVPDNVHAAESQEQAVMLKERCWCCGREGYVHYAAHELIGQKYGITMFDFCCSECGIEDAVEP